MVGPIGITQRQAEEHFDFILCLTDTQRVCWRIIREDAGSAMITPVNEVSPIPDEIQNQVEEFQKQFFDRNGSDS